MARARQQAEWARVGVAAAWIVNATQGGWKVDPKKIVPRQFWGDEPDAPELTPEEKKMARRYFWSRFDKVSGRN